MGNSNSSKINENKLINNNSNNSNNNSNNNNSNSNNSNNKDHLYEYKCVVEESELDIIEKNEYFTLYLCENHIVLKNKCKEFYFIYQNVMFWKSSSKFFGFCYKDINKANIITFIVDDGNIIADNLKTITYELVDYYKTI